MNYQKEYAILVGQVDRALFILEQYAQEIPAVRRAGQLLLDALLEAEAHFMEQTESEVPPHCSAM